MKKKLLAGLVIWLTLGCIITTANAGSILYFNDRVMGTDQMAAALTSVQTSGAHSVSTVLTSSDFANAIASGNYDLGIFFVQNLKSTEYNDGITALGDFVAGGGASIFTDWSMDLEYASLFGSSWTGNNNDLSITITDPALASSLTNPILLTDPGWSVYSMGTSGPYTAATFSNGEGAIAVSGRSITNGFLSDTFTTGADGIQLYLNEIDYVTSPVPVPGAVWLLGSGLFGLIGLRRRQRK